MRAQNPRLGTNIKMFIYAHDHEAQNQAFQYRRRVNTHFKTILQKPNKIDNSHNTFKSSKCSTTSRWIHKIIYLETYVTYNITTLLSWMMHSTKEVQDI